MFFKKQITFMSKQPSKAGNYKLPKGLGIGTKRVRGQPILHEECKVNLNLTLSPIAKEYLKTAAQIQGVSMSELVEQWARTTLNPDQV